MGIDTSLPGERLRSLQGPGDRLGDPVGCPISDPGRKDFNLKSTKSKAAAARAGFICDGIDKFVSVAESAENGVWYFQREQGETCPDSCPLKTAIADDGTPTCYARPGPERYRAQMMHDAAERRRLAGIIFPDLRTLPDGSKVRLQPAGDMGTFGDGNTLDIEYVEGLTAAAAARPDVSVWTYTHDPIAWGDALQPLRDLPNVSILASVDSDAAAEEAFAAGWDHVSIHRPDVDLNAAYTVRGDRRYLNCPQQRGRSRCGECMACFAPPRAVDGIMFSEH